MIQISRRNTSVSSGLAIASAMRGRSTLTAALLVSVSSGVLMWSGAAMAADSTSGDKASTVAEVVVTAERRTVNLQKAPVAATVLTGADLVKKGVVGVDHALDHQLARLLDHGRLHRLRHRNPPFQVNRKSCRSP